MITCNHSGGNERELSAVHHPGLVPLMKPSWETPVAEGWLQEREVGPACCLVPCVLWWKVTGMQM